MYFLSLETSTKSFALALSKDAKVLRFENFPDAKLLEDTIIASIDKLISSSNMKLGDLDAFAIGLGPGSFTSLRVGLSTVKSLCMALKKPVVGICSLDVLMDAVSGFDGDEICVLSDARRGMVYSALYTKENGVTTLKGGYRLGLLSKVLDEVKGRTIFVGSGAELYKNDIKNAYEQSRSGCQAIFAGEAFVEPKSESLAKLAFKRLSQNDVDDAGLLQPIYLYADDCQVTNVAKN